MSDLYPPEMGPTPDGSAMPRAVERKAQSATFWRRTGIILALAALASVVLFCAYGIYAIRATQNERGETLTVIKDCTQVGGECYERGQRQNADVLASAQVIVVLAAACAVDVTASQTVNERQAQISSCITKRLTPSP